MNIMQRRRHMVQYGYCTIFDNFLASYIYWDLEILLYVMLYFFFMYVIINFELCAELFFIFIFGTVVDDCFGHYLLKK